MPGLMLVIVLSFCVFWLSNETQMSATLLAIFIGFLVANIVPLPAQFSAGLKAAEGTVLSIAVALLGFQLNVADMIQLSPKIYLLIILSLAVTITATLIFSRLFKVNRATSWLVASGQGICGSAAIMAAQKIVKAPSSHSGLAVVLVNFLGIVGVLLSIFVAQNILEADVSGVYIGNTLQSMGHVVAAGFNLGSEVGQEAVLIKMYRILMLIPFLLFLILITQRKSKSNVEPISWLQLIPKFIVFFVIFVVISSFGLVNVFWLAKLSFIADVLFVMAMVAIGMSIRLLDVFRSSGVILMLCCAVFITQLLFNIWFLSYF